MKNSLKSQQYCLDSQSIYYLFTINHEYKF